jgi:hypothetical protein
MIEKRKSHREHLSTKSILSQQDTIIHGIMENISMCGALVRLDFGTYLPKGSAYDLTIYLEGEDMPLQINAEVVSVTFAMAGLMFVSFEDDSGTRLAELLQRLSSRPDKAAVTLEPLNIN